MAASYASRLDQIPSTEISVSLHSAGKLTFAHTRGNKNHQDRDASANSEVKTRSDFVVKYKFGQCGHHAVSRRAWKPVTHVPLRPLHTALQQIAIGLFRFESSGGATTSVSSDITTI